MAHDGSKILTCGKSFKSPKVNIAIAVDVAVQNCIFKNVTEHLRLYSTGSSMANVMHDRKKQQPQLMITNIGRDDVPRIIDAWL